MNRIALIDDDRDVLDALRMYLASEGFDVSPFGEPSAFLAAVAAGFAYDVIVSDVRMPGLSGLELLEKLNARQVSTPLILITGHGDVRMAVGAVKAGAFEFIEKPFDEAFLKQKIVEALERSGASPPLPPELGGIEMRVRELSDRQRQVMRLAAVGATNKEIAAELGISPRTVEDYRAWGMQRVGAKNLAELVRIVTWVEARSGKRLFSE